eukprot:gene10678-biopygen18322
MGFQEKIGAKDRRIRSVTKIGGKYWGGVLIRNHVEQHGTHGNTGRAGVMQNTLNMVESVGNDMHHTDSCGTPRNSTEQRGTARNSTEQRGTARNITEQNGTTRSCTGQHRIPRAPFPMPAGWGGRHAASRTIKLQCCPIFWAESLGNPKGCTRIRLRVLDETLQKGGSRAVQDIEGEGRPRAWKRTVVSCFTAVCHGTRAEYSATGCLATPR